MLWVRRSFLRKGRLPFLPKKVAELLGEAQADRLKELLTVESDKFGNERIYYSIDPITRDLMKKKKLSFRYFDYDSNGEKVYCKDKERYEVNPLGMVYSGENFYLVCLHDKYGDPASYCIDKMDDARAEKSKRSDWFGRKGKNRMAQKVKQLLGAIFSLAVEDNEEFEVDVEVDTDRFKRDLKRRWRHMKYVYVENKLLINIIAAVAVVGIGVFIFFASGLGSLQPAASARALKLTLSGPWRFMMNE